MHPSRSISRQGANSSSTVYGFGMICCSAASWITSSSEGRIASIPIGRMSGPFGGGHLLGPPQEIVGLAHKIGPAVASLVVATNIWLIGMRPGCLVPGRAGFGRIGDHRAEARIIREVVAEDGGVDFAVHQHVDQLLARRARDEGRLAILRKMRAFGA